MNKAPTILLVFDMEGITGVDQALSVSSASPGYHDARKQLTLDVNAAVRGLKEGGAGKILIQDGHGSGNSQEPDLLLDELDPRASMDVRRHPYSPYTTGLDGSFDAVVLVGMHAGPHGDGFVAHFDNPEVTKYVVNDCLWTETHLYAVSAARWGIPVLAATGDDVLEQQLRTDFPALEYVCVKQAHGHDRASSCEGSRARGLIESACSRAMREYLAGGLRPWYLPGPYSFEIEWQNHQQADGAGRHPLVRRQGEKGVGYISTDVIEGIERSLRLFTLAWDGGLVLRRMLSETPEGRELLRQWHEAMLARALRSPAAPSFVQPPRPNRSDDQKHFGLR